MQLYLKILGMAGALVCATVLAMSGQTEAAFGIVSAALTSSSALFKG